MMSKVKDICLCVFLLALAALIVIVLLTGLFGRRNLSEDYDKLSEEYSALEDKYYSIKARYEDHLYTIESCENDASIVWCYFEQEEDISFNKAHDSFMNIYYKVLHQ